MIYKMILFLGYSPKDAERHTGVRPNKAQRSNDDSNSANTAGISCPTVLNFVTPAVHSTEEAKTPFAAGPQYEPWHDAALQDKFLGFRGRLNRKRYFQRTLILAGLQVLLAFFFRLFQPDNPSSEELLHMAVMDAGFSFTMGELAARIIDAFLSVLQLGLALRRFHDLDRSWGSLFLLMIPFINLYFLFLLFCKRGTAGDNRFGPDPLMN